MTVEESAGLNGHSSNSSTIPKLATDPDVHGVPTQVEIMDKGSEEAPIEYIHGRRFGFIFAT